MASSSCYPEGRRYSRLEPPYVYSDRQQRYSNTSEVRTSNMTERETDTDTPPRKRIAVACGRCRKRKIRCSGDAGNGLPCQNCKAAGADNCMFLRVASQEAPWVQPTDQAFSYELKAARAYQAHHALGSPLTTSPTHYASDIQDGLQRNAHGGYSAASAGYPSYGTAKYYPTMPSWTSPATYPGDDGTGVDYSAMGYPYSYHSQDPAYLYRMTAAAKAAPNADLYVNTDGTGYGYGSGGAALVHRPASATVSPAEMTNFSLSNVAASLPHSGGDRLLPHPSRLSGTNNVLAYRTDASSTAPYTTSNSATSSLSTPSNTSPSSVESEVPTSYENASVPAYPPPSHTLPSMTHMHHRLSGAGDMSGYPPSTSSSGDSIFSASEASLRTQGSASDLSYKYTDASSTSSTGSGRRGSGETSSSGGSLSNGQTYTVTTPSSAMYAASMASHGRHRHVGAYALLSDEVEQQQQHAHHHSSGRRPAGSLAAS
ncbi:transcriptional regulatory protein C2H10.01 [Colletotrichum truncatum]|uniref:Transcriptional regulatory protein C2H10.01 n=1 Tax=Colletotrichum truncatum TaxID=5467 RepID=A0ACC3ZFM6_COLTU|nr:transcriptional regulatory protein C2H10.01 [Colletotrichum truncatum]KAF6801817.1 transcriptional regulatory protein C2H10.01 [Colletotrichum truncatum]